MSRDALSRIEELEELLDYEDLAKRQDSDEELLTYVRGDSASALSFKKVRIPGTNNLMWCDVSTGSVRPFVTKTFRRAAFDTVHRLGHPGINTIVKLMTERFVWPSMKSDCRRWTRSCIQCQRSKISRHVYSSLGKFSPSERFEHGTLFLVK